MKNKIIKIALLLLIISFSWLGLLNISKTLADSPDMIYVPDDYSTIQAAIDAANSGDTIIVKDGTYTENVDVNKSHLTIKSENGAEKSIVQAAIAITVDYININGLTINGVLPVVNGWGGLRGIVIYSSHNTISDCNIPNIYLDGSFNNIFNNKIYGAGGLFLSSTNNLIKKNVFEHSGLRAVSYSTSTHSNIVENNIIVNGTISKPLVYLEGVSDYRVTDIAGQVILINCNNITVENLSFFGATYLNPIQLYRTRNSKILNNDMTAGVFGPAAIILKNSSHNLINNNILNRLGASGCASAIELYDSSYNTIRDNIIKEVSTHINLLYSSNNNIYFNNFNNSKYGIYSYNSTNVWNSPEKISYAYNNKNYTNHLGNYWDDYTDVDTDNNGIWDNAYVIDENNQDDYSLVEPFENYVEREIPPENQLPTCAIELRKNGEKIDKIDVNEFFDIVFTDYSGDIKEMRFLSDESQNRQVDEGFTWTDWYEWDVSIDDWTGHWDHANKIKTWSFATGGNKEVWAEVKDSNGQVKKCSAIISSVLLLPEWKEIELSKLPDSFNIKDIETSSLNIFSFIREVFPVEGEIRNIILDKSEYQPWEKIKIDVKIKNNGVKTDIYYIHLYIISPDNKIIHEYGKYSERIEEDKESIVNFEYSFPQKLKKGEYQIVGELKGSVIYGKPTLDYKETTFYLEVGSQSMEEYESAENLLKKVESFQEYKDSLEKTLFPVFLKVKYKDTGQEINIVLVLGPTKSIKNYKKVGIKPELSPELSSSLENLVNGSIWRRYDIIDPDISFANPSFPVIGHFQTFLSQEAIGVVTNIQGWVEKKITIEALKYSLEKIGYKEISKYISRIGIATGVISADGKTTFGGEQGVRIGNNFDVYLPIVPENIYKFDVQAEGKVKLYPTEWAENWGSSGETTPAIAPWGVSILIKSNTESYKKFPPAEIVLPLQESQTILEKLLNVLNIISICSPGNLQVYDSQGRVTGLVNGEIIEEIPNSMYDAENHTVIIFAPSDSYFYKVVGTDEGTYGLTITSVVEGEATTFTATDIPTTSGQVHQYTIDWQALAQDEKGVTVKIDKDGDGDFEETFKTDSNFNMALETQIAITEMIYDETDILNNVTQDVGDGIAPLLLSELKESSVDLENYTPDGKLNPGQKKKLKMKFKFLETAGNEYQGKSINVNFKFLATQEKQ